VRAAGVVWVAGCTREAGDLTRRRARGALRAMDRAERRGAFANVARLIVERDGRLDSSVRRSAIDGGPVPAEVTALVSKIRARASDVTDADIDHARAAGYDEDQLFELTVATAVGESQRRLNRVLDLLGRKR